MRFFDKCYAEEIAVEGGGAKSLTAYDLKALSKDRKRLKEAVTRILEKDDAGDDLPRMTF